MVWLCNPNLGILNHSSFFYLGRYCIQIQHKDGTTASYQNFQNGGVFPKSGDKVFAGQAIGIIGGENYNFGSHLSFSVFYYEYYAKTSNGKETGEYYNNAYVPVNFHSIDGVLDFEQNNIEIESVHEESIITYEMSKREKKKWNKAKKSK